MTSESEAKYWVWLNKRSSPEEEKLHGVPPAIRRRRLRFDQGKLMNVDLNGLSIARRADRIGVLTDNLLAPGTRGLLFSRRLRELLAYVGVDNIQYFPIRIDNPVTGTFSEDYQLANIVGLVSCIDIERSDLKMNPDDGSKIDSIDSLVLKEENMHDFKLFRAAEYFPIIIARHDVRQACLDAGISGIQFLKPEDVFL